MGFTTTSRTLSYEIADDARFLALLHSESHVTGNAAYQSGNCTLCERLAAETPARHIDYNGHFGAQIILTLDEEDFTVENMQAIGATIERHLDWCQRLKKVR